MKLSAMERYRLEVLRGWHRRPPTWRRLVPRAVIGVVLYSGLMFALVWALPADAAHPHLRDVLFGTALYSAFLVASLPVGVAWRWRLTSAIIDWQRVEELAVAAKRKGV